MPNYQKNEHDTFDGYVTKYALTTGIQSKRLRVSAASPSLAIATDNPLSAYHGEGRDWHRTLASALADAEKRRNAKIVSLEKALKALRSLTFEGPAS
jgi:hypothetical protein